MDKNSLRTAVKKKRSMLSAEEIEAKSKKIAANVMPYLDGTECVMAYLSAFNEVCADGIIKELLSKGISVCVPVTDKKSISISPCLISNISDVRIGAYGIREPAVFRGADADAIDAVIVPGIVFDKSGNRVGFGMGYYDRFLKNFNGRKIGICYDFQLADDIDADENDIPMNIIITESEEYVI